MCTEKCFELTRGVTRRGALLGGVAVAASAALQGTAHAGERGADERGPAFGGRRRGLRDLTYPLTTSFPSPAKIPSGLLVPVRRFASWVPTIATSTPRQKERSYAPESRRL